MALEKQYGEIVLVQHGIKGMKWGQRRRLKAQTKQAEASTKQSAANWTKKYTNRSSMTTKDLKANVNRLTLENQFREQVIKVNSQNQSAGKKWLADFGKNILTVNLTNAVNAGIKYGVKAGSEALAKNSVKAGSEALVKYSAKALVKK